MNRGARNEERGTRVSGGRSSFFVPPSTSGFTLFEMLIVIMIIVLVAGASVAMLNVFFRGQGVRQGAMLLTQAFTRCKQLATTERKVHFLAFTNGPDSGRVSTYVDGNANHQFDYHYRGA